MKQNKLPINYFDCEHRVLTNLEKFKEEVEEFEDEYINYNFMDKQSFISEFHDVVQIMLHMAKEVGIEINEIIEGYEQHENKLIRRNWWKVE